jgi:hypothetical protein
MACDLLRDASSGDSRGGRCGDGRGLFGLLTGGYRPVELVTGRGAWFEAAMRRVMDIAAAAAGEEISGEVIEWIVELHVEARGGDGGGIRGQRVAIWEHLVQ